MTTMACPNDDNAAVQRILLLALMPIGDTLFTTPTLRALRERYPEAHITALVHASNAAIMRFVPSVDRVVVLPTGVDWRGSWPLLRTLRRLRARRFDVAIDFTSPAYKWISMACGIPRRTYMKFDPLWWLLPGDHRAWRATHAAEHYYNCARELDLPPWDDVSHTAELALPDVERIAARAFLHRHSLATGQPVVAVHAGGAWLGGMKRWPADRFVALADRLHERWNAHVVLLGSRDEAALDVEIAAAMRVQPLVTAGALPLIRSVALIEACDLFIGNDSGLLHAAAAVGTPYVGIFGPTSPENFHPLPGYPDQGRLVLPPCPPAHPHYFVGSRPIWTHPRGGNQVITTISVDAVYEQADALLTQAYGASRAASGAPSWDLYGSQAAFTAKGPEPLAPPHALPTRYAGR